MNRLEKFLFCLGLFFVGNIFTFFVDNRTGHVKEVFSFKIPLAELIFCILFIVVLFKNIKSVGPFLKLNRYYLSFLVLYLLSILFSLIHAQNKIVVVKDFIQMFLYLFGLSFILFSIEINFDFIIKSIFFISILHCFIVVVNNFLNIKNFSYGFFDHPNQLAIFVAMVLPFGFKFENKSFRWLQFLFFLLCGISLFVVQKRGALIAALCGLISSFILTKEKISVKLIIIIGCLFVLGLVGLQKRFNVKQSQIAKYFSLEQLKIERKDWWVKSIELFKRHPITGIGSSNFPLYFYDVEPHNLFLKLLSETGLLGFFSFMAIFIYSFVKSFKKHSFIVGSFVSILLFSMFNPAPYFIRGVGCLAWTLLHIGVVRNSEI